MSTEGPAQVTGRGAALKRGATLPMQFTRKNIRLAPEYYLGKRSYFITTCCYQRRPLLGEPVVAGWVIQTLQKYSLRYGFAIHAYCAMPDHLHFLALGVQESSNLLGFVGSFKQHSGFHYEQRRRKRLWQFKFYDQILRKADGVDDVSACIWMNPVRKGICADPFEYPLSGSFTMAWKTRPLANSGWMPPWRRPTNANAALKRGAT